MLLIYQVCKFFGDSKNYIGIDTNVNRVYCLHKRVYMICKLIISASISERNIITIAACVNKSLIKT
jgi:hypothetical protein